MKVAGSLKRVWKEMQSFKGSESKREWHVSKKTHTQNTENEREAKETKLIAEIILKDLHVAAAAATTTTTDIIIIIGGGGGTVDEESIQNFCWKPWMEERPGET